MRPTHGEYLDYFDRYISLVPGDDVVQVLSDQVPMLRTMLRNVTEEQGGYRYEPGKWSAREMVGHVADTERIFGFRALWFARGGVGGLPGFDQDPFEAVARHDTVPMPQLVDELCRMRESHVLMFAHFDAAAWSRTGTCSGHQMSARAAAFIMAGHVIYHLANLRERYGIA